MAALVVTISGDADKLRKEFEKVKDYAKRTGQDIQVALNRSATGGGTISSGAMREALVLMREISRGNWSRIPGSASLLLQKLGAIKWIMNPITAAVAGLAVGFFAAYKEAAALVDKLTGLKVPLEKVDYILSRFQKSNSAAEAQREINKEISRTVELYTDVENSSKRDAELIKEKYNHLRKISNLAGGGPVERAKIDAAERNEELAEKYRLQANLLSESRIKKDEANRIQVNSEEHDDQILKHRRAEAEEAQKYLDQIQNPTLSGKAKDALIRGYNSAALTGVSGSDLDRARSDNISEARRRIKAANEYAEQADANSILRERKKELIKDAAKSASLAYTTGVDISNALRNNPTRNKNEMQEAMMEAFQQTNTQVFKGHLTENQRIGAYISPGTVTVLDINRKQLREQEKMSAYLAKLAGGNVGGGSIFPAAN